MLQKGATEQPSYGDTIEYFLETPLGQLKVHPFDDWIALRFTDVARAKAHFGEHRDEFNPFTGKWNVQGVPQFPTMDAKRNEVFFQLLTKINYVMSLT